MADTPLCSTDGCEKPARKNAMRLCSMHEARYRRGGSLERRVERKSILDLLGADQFGHWKVLGEGEPYQRPAKEGKHPDGTMRTARCRCICGVERDVATHTLKRGQTRHCGCMVSAMVAEMKTTHGMSYTAEHRTWAKMKERCSNPNSPDWDNYGGRGIRVHSEWASSFEAFYAYIGPKPTPHHSIDRIDVNGNYEPGNVRWASPREQAQNVRHNVIVEFRGESLVLKEACRKAGVEWKYKAIHARMTYRGMTFAQALAKEGIAA